MSLFKHRFQSPLTALAIAVFSITAAAQVPQSGEQIQPVNISPDQLSNTFAAVTKMVEPAVVSIDTKGKMPEVTTRGDVKPGDSDDVLEFFRRQLPQRPAYSVGSGFIVDKRGYIMTNKHVVEGAERISVKLDSGEEYLAKVVGEDHLTDLAVLKIEAGKDLPFVKLGDSTRARVGDWVLALGSPFGLSRSVTAGIVSQTNRATPSANAFQRFIQTDAAINRGNSGGPLFNMQGEVVGINTAILSQTGMSVGIGFAVPAELAVNVVNQLKEFGETRRGWLGVRIQPVTDDIAESLKMELPRGALVSGIIEGGPITKGEIKPGDIIIRFDGTDIAEIRDLMRTVGESPVGKAVDVVIIRDGKEQTVRVTLGRLEGGEQLANAKPGEVLPNGGEAKPGEPPAAQLPASDTVLGMKLAELDADSRQSFGIAESVKGVVITEVQPNSPAAERRVEPGEVIVELGQEAMETPEDVTSRVTELKADGRRNALLMIANKSGELRFVTVRME